MKWFNVYGAVLIAVILVPNVRFAVKCRDGFANRWHNRAVACIEQIGRFGWWSDAAFTAYLAGDAALAATYCGIWAVCFRRISVFRALALSIIPSVLFAPSHVLLSYLNAK